MTLASALSNATSVAAPVTGHADTQYLGREFAVTTDAAQKASFEDLVIDLQKIFHRCKNEANRLNTAQKILITLGIIASTQGTSEEQAHFAKIKDIALSALTSQGQTDDTRSRANYFQNKLTLILYAKKCMTSCGQKAHAGLSYKESELKCFEVFEKLKQSSKDIHSVVEFYVYSSPNEDLSSFALSMLLRIHYLSNLEGGRGAGL